MPRVRVPRVARPPHQREGHGRRERRGERRAAHRDERDLPVAQPAAAAAAAAAAGAGAGAGAGAAPLLLSFL